MAELNHDSQSSWKSHGSFLQLETYWLGILEDAVPNSFQTLGWRRSLSAVRIVLLPSNPHAESEHNPSYHSGHSSQSDALSPSLSESASQSVDPSGYRGRTWLPDGSSQSEIESGSMKNIQETKMLPCNVSSHPIPVSGGGLQQKPCILRWLKGLSCMLPFVTVVEGRWIALHVL